ncbi:MAG: response regulator [Alphaproteobacteria bacterium]|nr:response regulator [Alphaproteobacteria bacterium]
MNTQQGAPGDPLFANLSVLLVEDDAFAIKIAQTVLRQLKVPYISTAKDGAEALDVLNSGTQRFDLIISDWNMPEMSGLQLLKAVRMKWAGMPFIMLTGKASPEFVVEARDNGVDAYVVKPFSPAHLGPQSRGVGAAPAKKIRPRSL